MSKQDVDPKHLKVGRQRPSGESQMVKEEAGRKVYVVVTQAFCPNGHNLVGLSPAQFDGFPGITLRVEHEGQVAELAVSPIHGDHSKSGPSFPDGAQLDLRCPACDVQLPRLTGCRCSDGGSLRALYLTPGLSEAHVVAICDVWGCHRSRVIDNFEILSEYFESLPEE
jgi:hypothetical protein